MRRRITAAVVLLVALIGIGGCVIVDDGLDYRHDLSDYEAKKIVRTVFLTQQSLGRAAMISARSTETIFDGDRYGEGNRYDCLSGGYLTLELGVDGLQLSLSAGDIVQLDYHQCLCDPLYAHESYLDGPVALTYHQSLSDSHERLYDVTLSYADTWLDTPTGGAWFDGRIGLHYDEDFDTRMHHLILSSDTLDIRRGSYASQRLYNIVLDFRMQRDTLHYRYDYSGTLYSDYLGRLTFSTLYPMEGYADRNPSAGLFKISNTTVTLKVRPIDDYYVDILLENRYDPSQNRTIHTTWMNIGLG